MHLYRVSYTVDVIVAATNPRMAKDIAESHAREELLSAPTIQVVDVRRWQPFQGLPDGWHSSDAPLGSSDAIEKFI